MVYVVPSLRERIIKLQMNERGNLSERRSTMYIEFQYSIYEENISVWDYRKITLTPIEIVLRLKLDLSK